MRVLDDIAALQRLLSSYLDTATLREIAEELGKQVAALGRERYG